MKHVLTGKNLFNICNLNDPMIWVLFKQKLIYDDNSPKLAIKRSKDYYNASTSPSVKELQIFSYTHKYLC